MPDRLVIDVPVAPEPLSPWLRLAHRWRYLPSSPGDGLVRSLLDHEILVQCESDSWIWVAALDGHIPFRPGDVVFIPPGLVHALGQNPGSLELAVHFDLVACPDLMALDMVRPHGRTTGPGRPARRELWFRLGRGASQLLIPLVSRPRDPLRFRERLLPLADAYAARAHRDFAAGLATAGTLAWALEELALGAPASLGEAPARARVRSLLAGLEHPEPGPLPRVAALARQAGLGQSVFRALVQELTGLPPRQHLEALRLDRAARLLLETALPIAAVATAAGYADPFHFSRAFSRRFRLSPRSYRTGVSISGAARRPVGRKR